MEKIVIDSLPKKCVFAVFAPGTKILGTSALSTLFNGLLFRSFSKGLIESLNANAVCFDASNLTTIFHLKYDLKIMILGILKILFVSFHSMLSHLLSK